MIKLYIGLLGPVQKLNPKLWLPTEFYTVNFGVRTLQQPGQNCLRIMLHSVILPTHSLFLFLLLHISQIFPPNKSPIHTIPSWHLLLSEHTLNYTDGLLPGLLGSRPFTASLYPGLPSKDSHLLPDKKSLSMASI